MPNPFNFPGNLSETFNRLDLLLSQHAWLWRPQPFKDSRLPWSREIHGLTASLLALSDAGLRDLSGNPEHLVEHLSRWIPTLKDLHEAAHIPTLPRRQSAGLAPHLDWAIPGRKLAQIQAFAEVLAPVSGPVLEWCGGKGHLGRLIAATRGIDMLTLEKDPRLCADGEKLAQRAGVGQRFLRSDVLSQQASEALIGRHALALHACGELHRTLARAAPLADVPSLAIAPCCYHLGAGELYRPFSPSTRVRPTHDDLRLAVTETATARPRELPRRDREMAWKLGYDLLRRDTTGVDAYAPIRPVSKDWLALDFSGFCRNLATRDGLALRGAIPWARFEREGWRRQRECMRLSLVRQAFRRPLELWLVHDLALHLASQGYRIEIGTFCPPATTPRNILLSAQRS